ncbi:MAG: hypothetical protein ACPGE9_06730, partial [Algiphilus sp.]
MSTTAPRSRDLPVGASLPELEGVTQEGGIPLVIRAPAPGTNLAAWLRERRDSIMAARRTHGAILFRGFGVLEAQSFEDAARVIAPDLQCDYLGQSPRRKLSDYVFTSTELHELLPFTVLGYEVTEN